MVVYIEPPQKLAKKIKGVWHLGGVAIVVIHLNGNNLVIFESRTSKFCMVVHIELQQKLAKKFKRGVAPRGRGNCGYTLKWK